MAIADDINYPRLTPSDDRLPSPERLFRKAEDLSDEQFDLLAAAWAEDALPDESLEEMETLIASSPEKRVRAESFRKIRLTPPDEIWEGKGKMIRKGPASVTIRRTVIVSLAAAAAIIAIITAGPALLKQKPGATLPQLQESRIMSEALIQAAPPIIVHVPVKSNESTNSASLIPQRKIRLQPDVINEPERIMPVMEGEPSALPPLIASADINGLIPLKETDIAPVIIPDKESNWIFRGISFIASAITKEEKNIDGYVIANACVSGINDLLGWDMELEQASNEAGEQSKVSFNSSLLSFSAPMNKNQP